MKLHQIAHARAGDKGDTSDITVIAYDLRDYGHIVNELTVERVRAHFGEVVQGDVVRYVVPSLGAVKFVMTRALGGGVTRTLNLDPHGKCLSSSLLEVELPDPISDITRTHDHEHRFHLRQRG
ncbi:AtuA-related protein [Humibacter sp.]|uniref:AtuA-related protein n=1 Tax=Humibacter sp. TaxID=1940291 RepID=UPI003F7F8653